MSYIDRVLGVAGMGTTLAHVALLKQFLYGVTAVIALTAIASTMAGMTLMVGFYGLYLALVHYGLDPHVAVLSVTGLVLLITALFAGMAVWRWKQLSIMPQLVQPAPIIGHATRLVDAFIDGLLNDHEPRRHRRTGL